MRQKIMTYSTILTILVLFAGCATHLRNQQLEKVAKDWSLVIRASQVIPVYPLSEDLQPGDVLLVSMPIEEQEKIYKKRGFLPLDQHLVRLYPKDYKEFYDYGDEIDDKAIPPKKWQTEEEAKQSWKIAPHVAFPTYQFSVETGSGLNLAIPIQGIPFALGLMNSGKASGTVTIADAYTYGLDNYRLEKIVRNWAFKNRYFLRNYESIEGKYHFLRVVSRVYVTGRVSVTVKNDEAMGGEAEAGADRPVNLIGIKEGSTNDNYSESIKAINTLVKDQLPGGKIQIATASSRSVTLSEEFTKPLVIGYVGFDIPILHGGRLGAPISTLAQLSQIHMLQANSNNIFYRIVVLSHMNNALKSIQSEKANDIRAKLNVLGQLLPESYPFSLYISISPTEVEKDTEIVAGAKIKNRDFDGVIKYIGNAYTTIEILEGNPQINTDNQLYQNLQNARTALNEINDRLSLEPVLMEAIDFVFLGD